MTTQSLSAVSNVYDDVGYAILRAAHTQDGTRLIGIGGYIKSPGDIVVWDTTTAKKIITRTSDQMSLSVLAVSPDDRWLAVAGSSTDKLSLWSLADECHNRDITILPTPYRKSVAGHLISQTHISDMRFTPSNSHLVMSCWDRSVKIVDLRDDSVAELTRHRRHNFDFVGVSPNEDYIVCGASHEVQVWELHSRTLRCNISLDVADLWSHIFLPSLKTVVSIGRTGRIHLLNLETDVREEFRLRYEPPETAFAFSPALGLLAIGQQNGRIMLWDTENRQLARWLSIDDSPILSMDFSPGRPVLATVRDAVQERVLELRV
jgi:WD40 repeat protein